MSTRRTSYRTLRFWQRPSVRSSVAIGVMIATIVMCTSAATALVVDPNLKTGILDVVTLRGTPFDIDQNPIMFVVLATAALLLVGLLVTVAFLVRQRRMSRRPNLPFDRD